VSFEVHVEVPIEELQEFMGDVEDAIDEWMEGTLEAQGRWSTKYAKGIARWRMPDGGGYIRKIKWRQVKKGPTELIGEVYNDHQWAQAVEEGTKPHKISSDKTMRAKPTLAVQGGKSRKWGTKYGGPVIYGRTFNHPGSRAFHIFRDTRAYILAVSNRIVEEVFRRIRRR